MPLHPRTTHDRLADHLYDVTGATMRAVAFIDSGRPARARAELLELAGRNRSVRPIVGRNTLRRTFPPAA